MPKTIKIVAVVFGLAFVFCIGRCLYMVACISCTPPPVKTYAYKGSLDQLENNFKSFAKANSDVELKISHRSDDTIGSGYKPSAEEIAFSARDVLVKLKIKGTDFVCNLVIYDFNGRTKLDIDSIFDNTHKMGGSDPDDKKVKALVKEFEECFFTRFNKTQHIEFRKSIF